MKDKHSKHKDEASAGKPAEPAAAEQPKTPSELDELKDRNLRLQADFDNFRKRTQREKIEVYQRAASDLILDILPAVDHFELGLQTAESQKVPESVTSGFKLVFDQLNSALKKHGLISIDCTGKVFDPNFHEAVTHLPSEEHPADTVMTETRRGYLLGDKLLRPSQVVVSSGPAANPAQEENPEPHILPPDVSKGDVE